MTLYVEDFEEGQQCPCAQVANKSERCTGHLEYKIENCSCHISPPCSACVEAPLVCDVCGWEAEDLEPDHDAD